MAYLKFSLQLNTVLWVSKFFAKFSEKDSWKAWKLSSWELRLQKHSRIVLICSHCIALIRMMEYSMAFCTSWSYTCPKLTKPASSSSPCHLTLWYTCSLPHEAVWANVLHCIHFHNSEKYITCGLTEFLLNWHIILILKTITKKSRSLLGRAYEC